MKAEIISARPGFARTLLASGLLLALVACGERPGVDPVGASTSGPQAQASTAAQAAATAETASAPANPLCAMATFAEVSAATGSHFDKVDVIDQPDLHYLDCVFLDSRDLYAGLTIRFVSTTKLVATSSNWQTAAAYFEEWSRGGDSVAGIGERAVWTDLPAGLLVLDGDQALQFSAAKSDLSDPAVRAKFEALAQAVVARMR